MNHDIKDLEKKYTRLQTLYRVSSIIHSTLDSAEAFKLIVYEAVRLTNATSGSICLVNPTSGFLEIEAQVGLHEKALGLKLRPGEGITGWVVKTGKPARVGDVHADPRYIMVNKNVRSELAVPLIMDDAVRGVLNVDSERLNAFNQDDQELLEAFAMEAVRVIRTTWLYEQIRLKAKLFESLADVSRIINSTVDLDEALRIIAKETRQLMSAKMCSLLLFDETMEWLDLKASDGAGENYINKPRLNVNESLLGTVVRRKKAIQVENVQQSSLYQHVDIAKREGLVSLLSVPLVYQNQAIGVLNVYTAEPHQFSNEEIKILSTLAELSAIAIQKARLYERILDAEEKLRKSERLSLLGLISAEVAHEIRNPLTVMKMLYHSLNLNFPENDLRAKDARIIGEKIEQLNRIVERMLDFARRNELSMSPLNINTLLEDLILLTRHKLRQHNIKLHLNFEPELPETFADGVQLEQAFLNLILNATDAMANGGHLFISTKTKKIKIERESAEYIAIEFRDTGSGMNPEIQNQAFNALLSSTKEKGTGLGLAIVKRIIDLHKGLINIKSKPGKGTLITILIPVINQRKSENQPT